MRFLWMLAFALCLSDARADYCQCEVFASSPLSASHRLGPFSLVQFKTSYFGKWDASSVKSCRDECVTEAQRGYDANELRQRLTPIAQELIATGDVGINCTGPTDLKFPVKVRARMGEKVLGIAHETMVFLHLEQRCL